MINNHGVKNIYIVRNLFFVQYNNETLLLLIKLCLNKLLCESNLDFLIIIFIVDIYVVIF